MKIKFIGVGSAFTTSDYYQSNMLITAGNGKKLLLDCGTDVRFALGECKWPDNRQFSNTSSQEEAPDENIDAIYISHLHSDHIGGMEWMAFKTYFCLNPKRKKLFMEENLMHDLWDFSLKGGLGCIEGKCMHLTDYFDCRPLAGNGFFHWEGIHFSLIKMPHVITGYKDIHSYGLLMEEDGNVVFITTDTQFEPAIVSRVGQKADIIFHDCETTPFKTIVHTHYDDLCTLPLELRQKIWLYHYQPCPNRQAKADGFRGFVTKGQEFDFV
ncbi:MBL fold metallo-hydrolase [Desulfonema magnum]|uniref:Beta-lactamase domain-containing protein n=1 Tax=Desulfonema magnum TaxID=45655 RepID=A0A975BLV6_9BACT|nr:MBL fold metallo-hydrolase [Desulfonema magnum]QTA87384.1 Beta-lactamase domain-containing protein [Desulfonema magnum]